MLALTITEGMGSSLVTRRPARSRRRNTSTHAGEMVLGQAETSRSVPSATYVMLPGGRSSGISLATQASVTPGKALKRVVSVSKNWVSSRTEP